MTPRTAALMAIIATETADFCDRLIERSLTPKQPPQSTRADVPVREANNGKA